MAVWLSVRSVSIWSSTCGAKKLAKVELYPERFQVRTAPVPLYVSICQLSTEQTKRLLLCFPSQAFSKWQEAQHAVVHWNKPAELGVWKCVKLS